MYRSKFLRTALFAIILAAPTCVGLSPVLAQDWQHRPFAAGPGSQAALTAARDLLESAGAVKRIEATFPGLADKLKDLARNDAIVKNAKFDVREMALRLFREHEEELLNEIAKVYTARFTLGELQHLNAFYRGQAGVRFLLFCQTIKANTNPDRTKAGLEAADAIGLSPMEMKEFAGYMRMPALQKLARLEAEMTAAAGAAGSQWGARIGNEIVRAVIEERTAGVSART